VSSAPRRFWRSSTFYIFVGLIVGVILGGFLPEDQHPTVYLAFQFCSKAFIALVKGLIVPLLFSTIVVGIAQTGDLKAVGRMGGKALLYFEIVTTFALGIGLLVVNVIKPGQGLSLDLSKHSHLGAQQNGWEVAMHLFPSNLVAHAAAGDILPVVVFATLFGVSLTRVGERGKPVLAFFEGVVQVMFKYTDIIMRLTPLGVFGAMAYNVSHMAAVHTVGDHTVGGWAAVASLLGPVVGGVFTQYLSWPWIFWVNVPVSLLALFLVRRALGGMTPAARIKRRIDVLGALLMLLALTALLVPITRVGQGTPWSDALNLGCLAAGAVLLAAFLAQERRHPDPMVSLALFKNRVVVACCALVFICFFNFIALSVLVPLRSQLVAGLTATDAGLRLLPMTLATPFAAFLSGRAMHLTGRVLPAIRWGVLLVPVGLLGLGFASPISPWATLCLMVAGMGMGLQMPPVLILIQQAVPRSQLGSVTGLVAFFRQLGGAIGIAVLSSVLLVWLRQHLPAAADGAVSEGLGALLKSAASTAMDGAAPGGVKAAVKGVNDSAFQYVMMLTAAVSLVSLWWLPRLPELGAQDTEMPAVIVTAE